MYSNNKIYISQVGSIVKSEFEWDRFKNKTFLITGASGLIGTFLVDVLMSACKAKNLNITVYAVARSEKVARERFVDYWDSCNFKFVAQDVNNPINSDIQCDYIIHGASNTHPMQYSADPIGTITANVIGTQNTLEFSANQKNARFMFLSSVEIYGENRGDIDKFDESYCGYIDCNSLRAGYPESKRLGEALCQAYIKAKNLDVVITRLSRVYGPTMSYDDSKAIAQFIKKAANNEDIILKSKGNQLFSYTYVADAVSAILYILIHGKCGESYNVSDEGSEIMLKDLAKILAETVKTEVIFELPDEAESIGYSKATKAVLNNHKLKSLGWKSSYNINIGLEQTVKIISSLKR